MNAVWDERHGKILMAYFALLNESKIKWFVIRGYKGLPENNESKDVDVMIEVGKEEAAANILKKVYENAGLSQLHNDQFGHIHCYIGMNIVNNISVHIDLVEGYISKGYEIFSFDELYEHVVLYNGINVLDDFMNGIMLLVYKIFGYHRAKLKQSYREDISKAQKNYPDRFLKLIVTLVGADLGNRVYYLVMKNEFDAILKLEPEFTKKLKEYTWRKRPFKTLQYSCEFIWQKFYRIVICYRKFAKTFAVIAPDGAGKTTFLDTLIEKMNYFYLNDPDDNRFNVYHFRPSILPNLGAVGERVGIMKQDINFTNPHRSKQANFLSSMVRIIYYTFDYIIGWQKCVRNDVHYDRYSVFDRYSYDFVVDPKRSKLNLPEHIRKFFVSLTPQPNIVFYLEANPKIIYARKQELTMDEIQRQVIEYRKLVQSNLKRFVTINAEQSPEKMANEATKILLERYTEKI